MATAATTMWSLDVVKEHLKVETTNHDDQITRFADGVSARIQAYIRRKIVTQTVIETLDGPTRCENKITLPDYPVSAITSVEVRASMLESWSTLDSDLYELDTKHGAIYLLGSLNFYAGQRTIRVTYSAGWGAKDSASIPQDLSVYGLDYLKFLYTRWSSDLITASSLSQAQRNATVPQELPKDLKEAIEHYVKRRI
jgi:uncharacterized phiE125 gp8 family phage protein